MGNARAAAAMKGRAVPAGEHGGIPGGPGERTGGRPPLHQVDGPGRSTGEVARRRPEWLAEHAEGKRLQTALPPEGIGHPRNP